MSDNWVVQNLQNALDTWNKYLSEIWQLITQSPEQFKGGSIWGVIVNIHDAVRAIGLALLVLFFVVGVMRTCGSFTEVKKPEHALKLFIRFAIAKGVVTYGLELMMALFNIVQGLVSTIMNAAGFGSAQQTVLPQEIVDAVESCGFFESIPLWAVTLIGGLFITVLSFIMIMTVYGRFFKSYLQGCHKEKPPEKDGFNYSCYSPRPEGGSLGYSSSSKLSNGPLRPERWSLVYSTFSSTPFSISFLACAEGRAA